MRGVGRSSAAISIVNALPTGIGCAHGVRLYAAATVELQAKATMQIEVEPDASRTPIVVRSLEATLRRLRPEAGFFARLHLDSEIPVAKGLKSSSAVATATIRAVADALETDRLRPGALVLLSGFGGGMTWASAVLRWGG